MSYNPAKTNYLNPNIEYLFNDEIFEFDIKDAGFSIIKQYKLLPDEKIKELSMMRKGDERHIAIGKLQRDDKNLSANLLNKFTEIRAIFVSSNNLNDSDIISVKKDAIYTIGSCSRLRFGDIEFVPKNQYTSYVRFVNINNLEVYYSSNNIDIKGIGEHGINRHRLYMLSFIKSMIEMIENNDMSIRRKIMRFISNYKSMALDDEYYIEFNNKSIDVNPIFNYKNILIPLVQVILKEMK